MIIIPCFRVFFLYFATFDYFTGLDQHFYANEREYLAPGPEVSLDCTESPPEYELSLPGVATASTYGQETDNPVYYEIS